MVNSPIALFTYKRLKHVTQVVDALRQNSLSEKSKLYVFSDGPRDGDEYEVHQVREFLKKLSGFGEIEFIFSKSNLGLSQSIRKGLNYVFEKHDRVIVLEDDIFVFGVFLGTYECLFGAL